MEQKTKEITWLNKPKSQIAQNYPYKQHQWLHHNEKGITIMITTTYYYACGKVRSKYTIKSTTNFEKINYKN